MRLLQSCCGFRPAQTSSACRFRRVWHQAFMSGAGGPPDDRPQLARLQARRGAQVAPFGIVGPARLLPTVEITPPRPTLPTTTGTPPRFEWVVGGEAVVSGARTTVERVLQPPEGAELALTTGAAVQPAVETTWPLQAAMESRLRPAAHELVSSPAAQAIASYRHMPAATVRTDLAAARAVEVASTSSSPPIMS